MCQTPNWLRPFKFSPNCPMQGRIDRYRFLPLCLTDAHTVGKGRFMKKHLASITKRLVAATLVIAAVVGVSALAMQASTPNQTSLAPSLKSIQTDKATSFYTEREPSHNWFVECALPGTSESKATTENLKVIATTL